MGGQLSLSLVLLLLPFRRQRQWPESKQLKWDLENEATLHQARAAEREKEQAALSR